MKIAIVSDMHFGYERFYEDSFTQAEKALAMASSMADMILIPGDVFDKRFPKPDVLARGMRIFSELSNREWKAKVVSYTNLLNGKEKNHTTIPIVAVSGTHERVAEGKENALMLLGIAGMLVDTSESVTVVEMDGEKVAVFGLGGTSEERVKPLLESLDPKPVSGAFNIFMFHQSTYELLPFSDEFIREEELPNGYDLYVDGHIHSRVERKVHGKPFLIPGSTVLTQLKDGEQESKGFILFDTSTGRHEFVQIGSRQLAVRKIEVKDAKPKAIEEKCEEEIEEVLEKSSGKPVIRIVLEGTIANGFTIVDMPVRQVMQRYAGKAYMSMDVSGLKSVESERSMEELRANRSGNQSIRELGASMLNAKLKEQKFTDSIDAIALFNMLTSEGNKDSIVKKVLAELLKEDSAAE